MFSHLNLIKTTKLKKIIFVIAVSSHSLKKTNIAHFSILNKLILRERKKKQLASSILWTNIRTDNLNFFIFSYYY